MNTLTEAELPAGLYLIATPIGNLRDITLRALDTLKGVDLILCEDTRVSGKLLKAYDIQKTLKPYHDHSDEKLRKAIVAKIVEGQRIAVISDAGTPLVSDPGYKLVRDCLDLGLNVTSVPGASAVLAGLQLSGLPTDRFAFAGFIPSKTKARCDFFDKWGAFDMSVVCFETGARLIASLEDFEKVLGDRPLAVVREITKLYEESRRGTAAQLLERYRTDGAPKGEIVLVFGGAPERVYNDQETDDLLSYALETMSVKEASQHVAAITGKPRKQLYERALKLKNE